MRRDNLCTLRDMSVVQVSRLHIGHWMTEDLSDLIQRLLLLLLLLLR